MASIFKSSIGKKFVMSMSGLFLILFLTLHAFINAFSIADHFLGTWGKADGLFQAGCDIMAMPIVTLMVPVLAAGFIIHIVWAFWLNIGNYKARGTERYEVASKAKADSWAAKNMIVLGIIVLGLLAFHLTHFWAKMQLLELTGGEAVNPYLLLETTFGQWWITVLYLVWFVALWFHLNHGFWSAFQSAGLNNSIWLGRLKVIGLIYTTVICGTFCLVAIIAFLHGFCACC